MNEDRTTTPGRGARRLLAVLGLLMAVAAIVVFAVGRGGNDDTSKGAVPEAGSKFGGHPGGADTTGAPSSPPLEHQVAQLFIAGFDPVRGPQRSWGGLLVTDVMYSSPQQLRSVLRRARRQAIAAGAPAPMVVADPTELGRLGPAPAPQIGAEGAPADARETARRSAQRLRRVGVGVALAPAADLGVQGGPAEDRAFSDDAATDARYVQAAVDGWRAGGVAPVPGSFPGEGAASQDPLEGPATVGLGLDELMARDIRPFAAATARAPAMQMSAALYAAWDGVTPATLLPDAVKLLRDRLGFSGAIVSADLVAATAATGEDVGAAAVEALRAGCDLLVIPGDRQDQDSAYRQVIAAVRSGRIPRARFDDALRHAAALRRVVAT